MAFHAQILFHPTLFGDPLDQTGRFMGIELIDDEHPCCLGIGFHGGANVADEIFFGARVPDRGADHLACRHLEVGDQRLRPVSDVFKLRGFRFAGLHRTGGVEPFQRLDAGFLIGADQVYSLFMEFRSLVIELAHRPHLFPELGFVFHFVVQPVFDPVGFQIPLILKNDPYWSRKSVPRCPDR